MLLKNLDADPSLNAFTYKYDEWLNVDGTLKGQPRPIRVPIVYLSIYLLSNYSLLALG